MKPTMLNFSNSIAYGKPGYPRVKGQPILPEEDRFYFEDGTYIHKLDAYHFYVTKIRESKKLKTSL